MSWKFDEIRPWTTELSALERLKIILFILAGNEDMHKSLDEFEIRPDPPLVSMAIDSVII